MVRAAELRGRKGDDRERIKAGIWKFGEVIPRSRSGNETKNTYCIYRSKLYKHIGKEVG